MRRFLCNNIILFPISCPANRRRKHYFMIIVETTNPVAMVPFMIFLEILYINLIKYRTRVILDTKFPATAYETHSYPVAACVLGEKLLIDKYYILYATHEITCHRRRVDENDLKTMCLAGVCRQYTLTKYRYQGRMIYKVLQTN